jgi:hypothetical protein
MAQQLKSETMTRPEDAITREVTRIRRNPPLVSVYPDSRGEGLQDAAAFKKKTSSSCFTRSLGLRRNVHRTLTSPPIEKKNKSTSKNPPSTWVGLDWSVSAEKQQTTGRRTLTNQAFAVSVSKRRRTTPLSHPPAVSNSNSVTNLHAFQQCLDEAQVMLGQFVLKSPMAKD